MTKIPVKGWLNLGKNKSGVEAVFGHRTQIHD